MTNWFQNLDIRYVEVKIIPEVHIHLTGRAGVFTVDELPGMETRCKSYVLVVASEKLQVFCRWPGLEKPELIETLGRGQAVQLGLPVQCKVTVYHIERVDAVTRGWIPAGDPV